MAVAVLGKLPSESGAGRGKRAEWVMGRAGGRDEEG